MLRAAAQPLLLLAQGDHLGAELLVRGPTHEPAVHVLGSDVGLHLVSVQKHTHLNLNSSN